MQGMGLCTQGMGLCTQGIAAEKVPGQPAESAKTIHHSWCTVINTHSMKIVTQTSSDITVVEKSLKSS